MYLEFHQRARLTQSAMSLEKHVDQMIKEAMAKGDFDNLPGPGKPIDLDAYFATPEHLRMGYSALKSADVVPEEMQLLKEIEELKALLDSSSGEGKENVQRKLSQMTTKFNIMMEKYR